MLKKHYFVLSGKFFDVNVFFNLAKFHFGEISFNYFKYTASAFPSSITSICSSRVVASS